MNVEAQFGRFGSGASVMRLEDRALVQGHGQYTDDVVPAGQLTLMFLRSPYAHARVVAVDVSAAAALPGVVRVISGAELKAAGVKPLPCNPMLKRADGSPCASAPRFALAADTVRYPGEAVAAVVAESADAARAALEAIVVEYEELPALADVLAATAPGAVALCDAAPDNISAEAKYGDAAKVEAAFAKAAHVVRLTVEHQRVCAVPMEPRTVLAMPDTASGRLTIRMSTQMPSSLRDSLCTLIPGLEAKNVRVLVGDVGGGFGMKTGMYPEDVVVAWAALQVARPVKWVGERGEEFLSTMHGRDLRTESALALDAQGRVVGLKVTSLAGIGGYSTPAGTAIQLMIGPWVSTSVYDIQNVAFHFKAVLTNGSPTGPYRGAGRPEAVYNIERLMDEAARVAGIDPVELRRRNMVRPEQMPYKNPMGQVYDTGRFEKVLDEALVLADWKGFDARAAASRARGKLRGRGIATFLEWTSGLAFEERVTVAVTGDGSIEIFSAVQQMGQGIATSLAQLAVDVFGVPMEKIRIVLGDTDRGSGFGSAGSRSIFVGGSALTVAGKKTIDRARDLAAEVLEAAPSDIVYEAGVLKVAGTDLKIDLFELAAKQAGARIDVESTTAVSGPSWPNACHICEVEVDPDTGMVAIDAYASVNDVGRVINPMIVRGQLDGGAVQGIGQALTEVVVYDRDSGQNLTGSLMDYALPKAGILPASVKTTMDESTPCQNNPLGIKGVGELGTIGATPTVVSAVADALARAGRAARTPHLQMPLTPSRVWRHLHAG
ncbi:MAG: xanthine dehydrogenase family protein molybdopterin-binding subunit [Burkholderiales bacterium]